MTEVRARAARQKGHLNFESESKSNAIAPKKAVDVTKNKLRSSQKLPVRLRRRRGTPVRNDPHPRRDNNRLHHRDVPQRCADCNIQQPSEDQSG